MKSILLGITLLLAMTACGGGGSSAPVPVAQAPVVTPAAPAPVTVGTYQSKASSNTHASVLGVAGTAAPIGTMPQTLIQTMSGFTMELDNWSLARGVLLVAQDGTLSVTSDSTLTNQQGLTVPLVLTGTQTGNELVGTTNGGNFDVTMGTDATRAITYAQMAGTFVSTLSSNGQVIQLVVNPYDGGFLAYSYATMADLQAAQNPVPTYHGNLAYEGITNGFNCFNFGLASYDTGIPTMGFAYFDSLGNILALSANFHNLDNSPGQISGYFVRQ